MSGRGEDHTGEDFDEVFQTDPIAMVVRHALNEPAIDDGFRRQLRERLLTEANQRPAPPPSVPIRPPVWRRRPTGMVISAAALVAAVLLIVTITAPWRRTTPSVQVSASSALAGSVSLNPASSVLIHFSLPMDHRSVEAALQIEPAVAVRTRWQGNDLLLTAAHGLAPNTGYLVGFNPLLARTATGARPKANPYVSFGTAPVAPSPASVAPIALSLDELASADDGSEAVIVNDGSVLGTALRIGGGPSSLARLVGSSSQLLAPATEAICVSRSGRSVAYLLRAATGTSIVMANGDGRIGRPLAAQVDAGSPLGWIGDEEVSFVSGGAFKAIDRTGSVRTLVAGPIHPETDTVAIAPGGRWIFLGSPGGQSGGRLVDILTHSTQTLPTAVGSPAFSADGATIYWVDGSGATPQLAEAPSGGGPVLHMPVPVAAGDKITDLGVNAGGNLLLYTVHHSDGSARLRLADLATGSTLAETGVAGQSPNWSPTGDEVTVLTSGSRGSEIDLIRVPSLLRSNKAAVEQTASRFARAQIGGDPEAVRSLSSSGVDPARLPRPSRSSLLATTRQSATTWRVDVRLAADPTPASPVQRAAIETLTIDTSSGRPVVDEASSPALAPTPAGPHVTAITSERGSVVLTFDSDLDPATLVRGIIIRGPNGQRIPVSLRYDPTAKAVIAEGPLTATTGVEVTSGIKDVSGLSAARVHTVVDTSPSG